MRDPTEIQRTFVACNRVVVRWFKLGVDGVLPREKEYLLSRHERHRADRFRFDSHRRRFVARRIALRLVIAEVIGCSPEHCPLTWTDDGRPVLDVTGPQICVSTSHSGELAVIAVAPGPVGVDVEYVDPSLPLHDLTDRCLAPVERRWLAGLPPVERLAGFCRLWTRKEAYLKARRMPMASVDLTQLPVLPGDQSVVPAGWLVSDLTAIEGCVGTLVAAPPAARILRRPMTLDPGLNSVAV